MSGYTYNFDYGNEEGHPVWRIFFRLSKKQTSELRDYESFLEFRKCSELGAAVNYLVKNYDPFKSREVDDDHDEHYTRLHVFTDDQLREFVKLKTGVEI